MESRRPSTSSLVAATLTLSLTTLGVPSLTRAAEVPAPTLLHMAAPDQASEPVRVSLRIDTSTLGSEGEPLAKKIEEVAGNVMHREGVTGPSDPMDPVVVVVIQRIGTEENPGYVVGFSIEKGDEIVPGSARQADCSLCTRGELIEKIEAEMPALLDLAGEHQVPAAGGDEGGGEEGGEEGGGDDGGTEDVKAIGPLGFAGIGVAVLGVAGVGVGAAFAARGVVAQEPTFEEATDFKTPGIVTLAVGGVALVAGVVMIAVDVSKRKKARAGSLAKAKIELRGAGIAF